MNNKFDELINEIHANKSQVIMVCETWWTDQSATNIVGFNLFRKDLEFSRSGGVCIYVENQIKSYQINEICLLDNSIEQVWCSIEIGQDNILCGCMYRTGVSDLTNCQKITTSLKYAYDAWKKGKYSGILICGDFNFSNIKWFNDGSCKLVNESDMTASNFLDCMKDCFIHQNVLLPTFQVCLGSESNLLDLILSENGNRINCLEHLPPLGGISHGHHVLRFNYSFKDENTDGKSQVKQKLLFKRGNYSELSEYFSSFNWEKEFQDLDANECYKKWLKIYNLGCDKFIPRLKLKYNKKSSPWMSNDLRKMVKLKKSLWYNCRHSGFKQNQLVEEYKSLNKSVKKKVVQDIKAFELNLAKNECLCVLE